MSSSLHPVSRPLLVSEPQVPEPLSSLQSLGGREGLDSPPLQCVAEDTKNPCPLAQISALSLRQLFFLCWWLGIYQRCHRCPQWTALSWKAPCFYYWSFGSYVFRQNLLGHCPFILPLSWGFSCGSAGKESACNAGDLGLIPGLGRSPGEGKAYPLQYSGLEDSMDYTVHGVTKSRRRLSRTLSLTVSFIVQKLLNLIRFHLFISAFISFTLEPDLKKNCYDLC